MVYSRGKFDIKVVERYYCSKCNGFHNKYRKKDGKKIQVFFDHAKFAEPKTTAEIWKMQFKENWEKNVKKQKKTGKPIGIPKRDKGKKRWGDK